MLRKKAGLSFACAALLGVLPATAADIVPRYVPGPYDVGEYDDGFGGNWDGDFPPYYPYATTGFGIFYQPEYSEAGHYGYSDPPWPRRPWHHRRLARRACRCRP